MPGKVIFHKPDEYTNSHNLLTKVESMVVGMVLITSTFFVKGVMGGFDCTANKDGRDYLDIEPQIECDRDRETLDMISCSRKPWSDSVSGLVVILAFVLFFLYSKRGKKR